MLLTISTTHAPATDLGYLLHKNPARVQSFDLSFGKVHVFYLEATPDRCIAALLLDVDPVGLSRRSGDRSGGPLQPYVNDRPYVASSFLSVAIAQVFGTALSGRSQDRPELADQAIPLEARIAVVPCRGGEGILHRLFAPLGYEVHVERQPLDDRHPEWEPSPLFSLRLTGRIRLRDLLAHLYVLIPVLDDEKHYWVGADEVEKLLRHGEGWLAGHPERELISRRYLKHQRTLVREALARLTDEDSPDPDVQVEAQSQQEQKLEQPISLNEQRLGAVMAALKNEQPRRVLDLGCGEGKLLRVLLDDSSFERIVGVDVSHRSLEIAAERLNLERLPPMKRARIELLHGSLLYRDKRLSGFDAAAVIEVVEHLDHERLSAFARVLFEHTRPGTIILTTPNAEYNVRFAGLPAGKMRHSDHRFEWTRAEFESWARENAERYRYDVRFLPVGTVDPDVGAATQMGIFRQKGASGSAQWHAGGLVKITLPDPCLVLLVGPSGAGKSSFARKYFKPTAVLSSDFCRGLVADDENDQAASPDAFAVLQFIAGKRLSAGRLTVVDATNVQKDSRKPLLALAREHDLLTAAIVLNIPEKICAARNLGRPDRTFGAHVIRGQIQQLRRSLRGLRDEGFRYVYLLESTEAIEEVVMERTPLWTSRKEDHGPFDIIGDIHGCTDELETLLANLGYIVERDDNSPFGYRGTHPQGRRVIFLGDLVDRGPRIADALRLVMSMVETGTALCVPGNHETKLLRKLKGKDVRITHGLAESLAQLEQQPPEFREKVGAFIDKLISHYVLDDGKLVVAHAGMKQAFQGRASGRVRDFALFGETTGETDEFGLPVRYDWASDYRGKAMVVYGHTPVVESEWVNRTINIDNGCVFGGKLTALRYPERELVSVSAARVYYASAKPFPTALGSEGSHAPEADRGELLDLDDVMGKSVVQTTLHGRVTIREENASAALEVMSRFAVDPRWLIYLPPTMSPSETTSKTDLLEHPDEAFAYYRHEGIPKVVCEEKHMGSRAVVIVCRDREAARTRFGDGERIGVVYTRTGRPFFREAELERALLERVRIAIEKADVWATLDTTWVCLDCELMPWSAKATELLRSQYAPVGAAARVGLEAALEALTHAEAKGLAVSELIGRFRSRSDSARRYVDAYRRYCWDVDSLRGIKLAPFHFLASERHVHTDKDHEWHMDACAKLAAVDGDLFVATPYKVVDVTDDASQRDGASWWESLTERGGEGMVVKPCDFVAKGRRGIAQPAVKVRGREYLRIIYGPEYTAPENLSRLRDRGLSAKRSLALREFALGIEALDRVVRHEPLYRVHQCVFGVLALESEPVDPRL